MQSDNLKQPISQKAEIQSLGKPGQPVVFGKAYQKEN